MLGNQPYLNTFDIPSKQMFKINYSISNFHVSSISFLNTQSGISLDQHHSCARIGADRLDPAPHFGVSYLKFPHF